MRASTKKIAMSLVLAIAGGSVFAGSAPTIPLNYGHTGTWYQPETSGQGLLIEVVPASNTLVVSWFTYAGAQDVPAFPSADSEQRWYFAQGDYADGAHAVELQILRPAGGIFVNAGAASFPIVGSATVSFESCDSGQLRYQFSESGFSGQIPLTRLFADGICAQFLGR